MIIQVVMFIRRVSKKGWVKALAITAVIGVVSYIIF